jgi:hypothetical protein
MAQTVADLRIEVDGTPRTLALDDLSAATVAAIEAAEAQRATDAAALQTLVANRLVASILTDPVVVAVGQVRDRLPAALDGDGGVKVHVTNEGTLATEAAIQDLLSRVGPTAADNLLALLRTIATNTGTEVATVATLKIDADHIDLSTDGLEALLTTLNALVASESTLAALRTANHTDLAALLTSLGLPADASSASTVIGLLKWLKTGPVSVESSTSSKGYQQLTSDGTARTIASLCTGAALPTGATKVILIPSAPIRMRDDGTNPTASVGQPVNTSGWNYTDDKLAALKVINAATIDAWFYS